MCLRRKRSCCLSWSSRWPRTSGPRCNPSCNPAATDPVPHLSLTVESAYGSGEFIASMQGTSAGCAGTRLACWFGTSGPACLAAHRHLLYHRAMFLWLWTSACTVCDSVMPPHAQVASPARAYIAAGGADEALAGTVGGPPGSAVAALAARLVAGLAPALRSGESAGTLHAQRLASALQVGSAGNIGFWCRTEKQVTPLHDPEHLSRSPSALRTMLLADVLASSINISIPGEGLLFERASSMCSSSGLVSV